MKVNFDNLRRGLIRDYNSLCKKLNKSIVDKSFDPCISLDPSEICNEMEGLRNRIVTLACTYQDGEDGYKELDDFYVEEFNPEDEETQQ